MDMPDDKRLVERFRSGDEGAFDMLVRRYAAPVYAFLYGLVDDRDVAEDLAQETFVKAWKRLADFDPDGNVKAWLFRVARNAAYDFLKKKKAVPFSFFENEDGESPLEDISDGSVLPDRLAEREESARLLEEKLKALPEAHRTLLVLRYREDFSLSEIAEIFGEPYNTVKSRYRRALKRLREAFGR
jgi:RNA polymerase sigma-70 factor (ECF subfamily)